MYHPYFRGKQYELVCIRENAQLLATRNFVPIIEPVRKSLRQLEKALEAIGEAGGRAIVIINPDQGDHAADTADLRALIGDHAAVCSGVTLRSEDSIEIARELLDEPPTRAVSIVHAGFTHGKLLVEHLQRREIESHVFIENHCSKLYRRNFQGRPRILLRDGFQLRNNKNYPDREPFSDLHVTFAEEEGMTGFGDFLIVGDEFRDAGGPAWAVAIHITCIDRSRDDEMLIYHFKSDTNDTPADPAGKFAEALARLIEEIDRDGTPIEETRAILEFRQLHAERHFPGLGYVKKLSMQHHVETLARYCEANNIGV